MIILICPSSSPMTHSSTIGVLNEIIFLPPICYQRWQEGRLFLRGKTTHNICNVTVEGLTNLFNDLKRDILILPDLSHGSFGDSSLFCKLCPIHFRIYKLLKKRIVGNLPHTFLLRNHAHIIIATGITCQS